MKITTKPRGDNGDLVVIKKMTPDIIKQMDGRQVAYFYGIKIPGKQDVKLYAEIKHPPETW